MKYMHEQDSCSFQLVKVIRRIREILSAGNVSGRVPGIESSQFHAMLRCWAPIVRGKIGREAESCE
ncbi:MAG: hypothetical protein D6730_16005 [Bacteroidetes bacterium]|nr:MAG: hypothetical protein D6730_16005 [Bacteroidota bacterium]